MELRLEHLNASRWGGPGRAGLPCQHLQRVDYSLLAELRAVTLLARHDMTLTKQLTLTKEYGLEALHLTCDNDH